MSYVGQVEANYVTVPAISTKCPYVFPGYCVESINMAIEVVLNFALSEFGPRASGPPTMLVLLSPLFHAIGESIIETKAKIQDGRLVSLTSGCPVPAHDI